ncbi:MAG: hypothetical protein ACUVX8_01895 [Candidatus Zipacnadales bacterium]
MKPYAWRALLFLIGSLSIPLLTFIGCAKPVFTIVERKVCRGVDGSGKPVDVTTTFAPEDGRVFVWFRYQNAAPGYVVKVKFTYTDELGEQSTQEQEAELKPGSSAAAAELTGPDGGPLAPGRYTVEIMSQTGVAFGPALSFTVKPQSATTLPEQATGLS